jgi:hypothetical protein
MTFKNKANAATSKEASFVLTLEDVTIHNILLFDILASDASRSCQQLGVDSSSAQIQQCQMHRWGERDGCHFCHVLQSRREGEGTRWYL